jgi:release factor glutamine methyltransferase
MVRSVPRAASTTVRAELAAAREALRPSRTASLDAQVLLAEVLLRSRSWLLAHDLNMLTERQVATFRRLIARRAQGEPVAYLRGHVEWAARDFVVTPDVLIPRPETELLAERAAVIARERRVETLADIGTGSGAIATYLAQELPAARIYAVDVSAAALRVAARNLARHGVAPRVALLRGNLLEPLPAMPGLIAANLPYLSGEMMHVLDRDVRYEPAGALQGGQTGLELYAEMFEQMRARGWLTPLVLEIDPRQSSAMRYLLTQNFPFARLGIMRDYAGHDRIVVLEP